MLQRQTDVERCTFLHLPPLPKVPPRARLGVARDLLRGLPQPLAVVAVGADLVLAGDHAPLQAAAARGRALEEKVLNE